MNDINDQVMTVEIIKELTFIKDSGEDHNIGEYEGL